tara:strand:- start:600 stop:722 length:123 start_codon:yes stop_codon:yes gene_type:complete
MLPIKPKIANNPKGILISHISKFELTNNGDSKYIESDHNT